MLLFAKCNYNYPIIRISFYEHPQLNDQLIRGQRGYLYCIELVSYVCEVWMQCWLIHRKPETGVWSMCLESCKAIKSQSIYKLIMRICPIPSWGSPVSWCREIVVERKSSRLQKPNQKVVIDLALRGRWTWGLSSSRVG